MERIVAGMRIFDYELGYYCKMGVMERYACDNTRGRRICDKRRL